MAHHSISLAAAPLATLVAFKGVEEMSRLYRFEAFVRTPPGLSLGDDLLWTDATLELQHDKAPDGVQRWHGTVKALRLVEAVASNQLSVTEGKLWQVTIVPHVYKKLALSRHSRVFTGLDLKGLLEDFLPRCKLAVGADVRLDLSKSYPVEEQITQYRESDLDFLSRWLEHHGVRFYFEQGEDEDVMIISDKETDPTLRDGEPVRYGGGGGDVDPKAGESFAVFRGLSRTRPAAVEVDDYDYGNPTLVAPERKQISRDGLGRVRVYGERAVTPDYLGPTAERRAAMWAGGAATFTGTGDVAGLRPGYAFEVSEHLRESMNGEYLALRVEHRVRASILSGEMSKQIGIHLSGERLHEATVFATRAGGAFHPPLRTPRPRATGVERAVIDGPADHHYAQIDAEGRYRVRFHFDEGDCAAGKASVAVRMMQMHAGNPEGHHFPLRKKTEVLVAFVGGDPDRPHIVGGVNDAHTPSPVTSNNNTLNVFHTGSDTRLEIEDQSGSQSIVLSTPPQTTRWHMGLPHSSDFQGKFTHHFVETTQADCLFDFGGDQDVNVGAKLWEIVEDAVMEIYKTSLKTDVTGPQTTHVTGPVIELYGATQATDVKGLVTETYDSPQITAVAGLRDENYVGGQTSEVKSFVVELYAGTQDKQVSGLVTENYNGPLIQSVSGSTAQTFAAPVTTDFGPTMWIQPSIAFDVPGGATFTTPMWVEVASVFAPTRSNGVSQTSSKFPLKGVTIAITGALKLEFIGLIAEACGFKMEGTGPNISAAILKIEVKPIKIETNAALRAKKCGFRKLN
jgi:type VI secretion system secreted protein VgrG